ncbi:DNA polymerase Y family protein [Variovorax terrae]|uniref:DNA polymerase Y family protein n=1 Tax=Variovorax terrae TaxID=2923278 RepID=A0A9X1VWS0_9BURK|nr:DNA polymerase Y family protein [Variovorax terrae]MCJ0763499.1 DNA polymerase Y family protein [Variovorax terrae]
MPWIALQPSHEDERAAWGWRALQFTPRVAQVDEALLLDISGSERLFGGQQRLLRRFLQSNLPDVRATWSQGATSLIALALLRLKRRQEPAPPALPAALPLDTLSAAREHLDTLARTGCRTWGELRALPRGGVARRFGAALLDALDAAWGERPERYPWLTLPEVFDLKLELPALATSTPELLWAAQRLLAQLQAWLRARQRGVLALELEWTLDLRRLNGQPLPPHEQLLVRTTQPAQDMAHLRRLLGEHLARARLSAPASHLRLRSLETAPWAGASHGFLPEDNAPGDKLHQLVERLSARLGAHSVVVPQARADHRPERMQQWRPAQEMLPRVAVPDAVQGLAPAARPPPRRPAGPPPPGAADALYPAWLLPEPLPLEVHQDRPHHGGAPLRRLTRLYRVETGWWEAGRAARRDYFIARSDTAGLVWIYREHAPPGGLERAASFRWYLQGLYA